MAVTAAALESLAKIGCNISVRGPDMVSTQLESLLRTVVYREAHLTIRDADQMVALHLESLARIGGKHLTVQF